MSAHLFANAPDTLGSAPAGFLPEGLEREVRKIYERSPIYVQRFPLHFERLKWSCFQEIPALSKKEIVERGHQAFFPDYEEIGFKDCEGNHKQLNTHLLQIENEFYSAIRPKRTAASGETPLHALSERGVEYIEVRCVDLNPLLPCGIDMQTMCFLRYKPQDTKQKKSITDDHAVDRRTRASCFRSK